MRIFVKAKPSAHEQKVVRIDDTNLEVSVTEPPVQGRANRAIIDALAEYFGISSVRIRIVSGHISRRKVVEIE